MMDEQELQWLALLRDERDKREAARVFYSRPRTRAFSKALRDWWGAIEAPLKVYKIALAEGRTLSPPPIEILECLEVVASCLATGKLPGIAADAISQGRRGAESRERRDLGLAVAYMQAASGRLEHAGEQVLIEDWRPVATICEAFGVGRSTAQGWRKNIEPAFLGVHRIDGEILASLMRDAGARYKTAGRSASATASRCPSN
jgi:hypothetical protein